MMQIRQATPQDVQAIQTLMQPYMQDFVVDESGLAHFTEQVVLDFIHHSEVHSFVAEQDQSILGVIAYREPAHLLHFFVDQHHQSQGIGKQLIKAVHDCHHLIGSICPLRYSPQPCNLVTEIPSKDIGQIQKH